MTITSSWSTLLSIDTYSVPIWLFLYPRIYLINKMHQLPDPVLFVAVLSLKVAIHEVWL